MKNFQKDFDIFHETQMFTYGRIQNMYCLWFFCFFYKKVDNTGFNKMRIVEAHKTDCTISDLKVHLSGILFLVLASSR